MNEESQHPLHMLDNQADPETKPKVVLQKSIRTYESDVAEAIANRKSSVMSIAIAENKKKIGEAEISNKEPRNYGKKALVFIISIALIAIGIGGGYYLYLQSPLAVRDTPAVNNKIPSLLESDKQKIVSINGLSENQIVRKVQESYFNEDISADGSLELILTQTVGSTTVRVTAPNLINKLNLSMSDTLIRSIKDSWMFGIINSEDVKSPFVLLKNDFFQNAYAGMLKWEKNMPDDLADVLEYRNLGEQNITSTSSISQYFSIRGAFEDRTIMNRDVREFRNENGQLLVLYSFIDKDTILITTSEATLKSVIEKIEKQNFVR